MMAAGSHLSMREGKAMGTLRPKQGKEERRSARVGWAGLRPMQMKRGRGEGGSRSRAERKGEKNEPETIFLLRNRFLFSQKITRAYLNCFPI